MSTASYSGGIGDAPEIILPPFSVDIWDNDVDLVRLRSHFTDEMRAIWEHAMNSFIKGDWIDSREKIQLVLKKTDGQDGPAKLLLQKITDFNGIPPKGWKGFRPLT